MKNPSAMFDGGNDTGDRRSLVARHREDWRLARVAHADLVAMRMPRANLLLKGRPGVLHTLIGTLLAHVRDPIKRWRPGEALVLPPPMALATLLLEDIDELTAADQAALYAWLDGAVGRTQVISTTTVPLVKHVEAGYFHERLYYRLNVVCIDVSE